MRKIKIAPTGGLKRFVFNVFVFCTVTTLVCICSCKDKLSTYSFNYHLEYYPTDSAHYVDYVVDSITYSFNGKHNNDTAHYLMRELVADTFYDNLGKLNYSLELYRRPDSNSQWTFWKKWFARMDSTNTGQIRLLKSEDDLKFVKLVFPPVQGQSWNGNEYLPVTPPYDAFYNWNYFYGGVDTLVTINGVDYPHSLVVSEIDEESLIDKYLRREVYSQNVGMIYQEWEILNKQNVQADWITGPENGFRIRMSVIGHYP